MRAFSLQRPNAELPYAIGHISSTPVGISAFQRLVVNLHHLGEVNNSLEQAIRLTGASEVLTPGHCVTLKWECPPTDEELVGCLANLGAELATDPSPCRCGDFPACYWLHSAGMGLQASCSTCRGLAEKRLPANQPHSAPFFGEIDWIRRQQDGHRGVSSLFELTISCPITGPLHRRGRLHLETTLWMPDRRKDRPAEPQFKVVLALARQAVKKTVPISSAPGWPEAAVSDHSWPPRPTRIDHSSQVEFDGQILSVGLPLLEMCTVSEVDFLIQRAIHLAGLTNWNLHRQATRGGRYRVAWPLRQQVAIEGPSRDEDWLLGYPDRCLALRALGKQALLSALSLPARMAAQTECAVRGWEARDPLEVLRLGLSLLPPRLLTRVLETLCPLAQASPARARQLLECDWPDCWDWQPDQPACREIPQYAAIRRHLLEPTRHRLAIELTLLQRVLVRPEQPGCKIAWAELLLSRRQIDDARRLLSGLANQSERAVLLCLAELAYMEKRGPDLSCCARAILDGPAVESETLVALMGLLEDLGEDQQALTVLSHLPPDPTLHDYVSSSVVRLHGQQPPAQTLGNLDPVWVRQMGGEVHVLSDGKAISGPFYGCDCLLVFQAKVWLFRFIVPPGVPQSVVAAASLGLFLEVDATARVDSQPPFLSVTLTPGRISEYLARVPTLAHMLRRGGQFEPACMVCHRRAPRFRVRLDELQLERLCERCQPAWRGLRMGADRRGLPDGQLAQFPPWHSPLLHQGERRAELEHLAWKQEHGGGLVDRLRRSLAPSKRSTGWPGIRLEVEPIWNDWLLNELGRPIVTRLDLSCDVEVESPSGVLRVGLLCLESMDQEELLVFIKRSVLRFRQASIWPTRAVDTAICRSLPAPSLIRAACKQEVLRQAAWEARNMGIWLAVAQAHSQVDAVRLVLSGLNFLPVGFTTRLLSGADPGQRLGPFRLVKLLGGKRWPQLDFSPPNTALSQLLNYPGIRDQLTKSANQCLRHELTLRQAFVLAQGHRLPPLNEPQRQKVRSHYAGRNDLEAVRAQAECAYFEGNGGELARMASPLLLLGNLASISNLANMLEDLGQVEQAVICWKLLQKKTQGEQAARALWNLRRLSGN